MLSRRDYLQALRDMGFSYKNQRKRTQLYTRMSSSGSGTDRVFVPRNSVIDENYARKELLKHGMSEKDVALLLNSNSDSDLTVS